MCSIRHDDEQDCIDSGSDGSIGGGSSDSEGSSEEEEEEGGDSDAQHRKKSGMLMMVRQEAPKFTVDGCNSGGAHGLNEVRRLSGHHCCCYRLIHKSSSTSCLMCSVAALNLNNITAAYTDADMTVFERTHTSKMT